MSTATKAIDSAGSDRVHPTRFPILGYNCVQRGLWRVVDMSTGAHIGPQYRTQQELLGDLERYAEVIGA